MTVKWLPGNSWYRVCAVPCRQVSAMVRLWRLNSPDSRSPTTTSSTPSGRDRPEQRRNAARLVGVEPQILIHAQPDERGEIEDAGNRVAGRHEIGRRLGIERRPIGRDHGGGKLPAGRVAVNHEVTAEAQPEEDAGAPDLLDDVADGDDRTQIVADHRDGDAALVQAARHVAERGRIERAPITAVNEQSERGGFCPPRAATDRWSAAACRHRTGRARRGRA